MVDIFSQILSMSVSSVFVIFIVILFRLIMRKMPKKYSYALWLVVAFRLCSPVSFRSVLSIFNFKLLDKSTTNTAERMNAAIAGGTSAPSFDLLFALSVIWLCGMVLILLYSVFSYIMLCRRMRISFSCKENVFYTDTVSTPIVLGFWTPRIYIPFGLDKESERYVLVHERYHITRGDNLIKLIAFLILCIHWFNPFCWLAFILMSRDMEMSCDEKVLESGTVISKDYSMTLLSFATKKGITTIGALAFGEVGIKRRIKNTLNWKRPTLWVSVISILLCMTVITVCATDKVAEDEKLSSDTEITMDDTTEDRTYTSESETSDTQSESLEEPDTSSVETESDTQEDTQEDTQAEDTTGSAETESIETTPDTEEYYYYYNDHTDYRDYDVEEDNSAPEGIITDFEIVLPPNPFESTTTARNKYLDECIRNDETTQFPTLRPD